METNCVEIAKKALAIVIVLWGCVSPSQSLADQKGNRHNNPRSFQPSQPSQSRPQVEYGSAVTQYLANDLKVEDPADYNLTLKWEKRLAKLPDTSPETLKKMFTEQSATTLGEIFRSFGRTQYNNVIALGQAGVGKTHLIDQLVLLFTNGLVPEYLEKELGMQTDAVTAGNEGPYQVLREAFLGKTDIVLVNISLLNHDNTKAGKAFASETVRMSTVLSGLFAAAKVEFEKGRRTLFLFDEVATLPPVIQATMKKILDESGFKNPHDPMQASRDPGFMVMAMTTPDEFREMVKGDSAIERRYAKVRLQEPTEDEAFQILRNQADFEWTPLYGLQISDDALRFLIRMRRFIDTPPLAMPASVISATNDLYLAALHDTAMQEPGHGTEIDLPVAQRFLMNKLGMTEIWFEGPNGEPPFTGFAEKVKKLVVGQDAVIDKITDRITAWARLGYGGDLPVFFLGGSSGSGKDTLLKALNQVMFGHEGKHLMFSLGGVGGFGIESIIEGPPIGNHSDSSQGLLVQALENGPSTGILGFNEGKDTPTLELEKLKVFIESGEIRPKGRDARVRPLKFPVFIMGQWGEELFDGKTDAEIAKIYAGLTQLQIETQFLQGKDSERKTGAVSRAMLDRAKRTGGVFMLKPVAKKLLPEIVKITVASVSKRFRTSSNLTVDVSPALIQFITEMAIEAGEGPRGLGATTVDFTETAISRAMDLGLSIRNVAVSLDYQPAQLQGRGSIVLKQGEHVWKIDAEELRRIKLCEFALD